MKGLSFRLCVDYLELCYVATPEMAQYLIDLDFYDEGCFSVGAMEQEGRDTQLSVQAYWNSDIEQTFGTLRVAPISDRDTPCYVWFKVANWVLYDEGAFYCLDYITDSLGLTLNNITRLDVAIDTTHNHYKRLRAAIRCSDLVPVVLGRAYPNMEETIAPLLYIHSGNRIKYTSHSIAIANHDKTMRLAVYDKSKEIKQSGKEYITKAHNIKKQLWRIEVRLRRKALLDYLTKEGKAYEDILYRLRDEALLWGLLTFFCDRLLHFQQGRKLVSMLDV